MRNRTIGYGLMDAESWTKKTGAVSVCGREWRFELTDGEYLCVDSAHDTVGVSLRSTWRGLSAQRFEVISGTSTQSVDVSPQARPSRGAALS